MTAAIGRMGRWGIVFKIIYPYFLISRNETQVQGNGIYLIKAKGLMKDKRS